MPRVTTSKKTTKTPAPPTSVCGAMVVYANESKDEWLRAYVHVPLGVLSRAMPHTLLEQDITAALNDLAAYSERFPSAFVAEQVTILRATQALLAAGSLPVIDHA